MTEKTTSTKSGFSAAERAAMKERAKELKASQKKADLLEAQLAAIADMPDEDRVLAERVHAIVSEQAPHLFAKLWYGMPSYADEDGKSVVFFKGAAKFDGRFATLGFNDPAQLDEGKMWATSYALVGLDDEVEAEIARLVRKSVGAA
ncbi:DUF1801 domain-containing protein [Homoserinibacter sp. YIM 151385]|uniref:DUF1801 domain-containing protein n=1 Tax=Homoserinibacter sp. YIM 151385 TaxID=2985506 RepID=UPI0022F0E9B4|nr:DUF1801 domain-containing protein [Homoserinibacter sp. YIM 151385]WBU38521.1 DUF1801 domain-containing protein [Homoserinibacter sp. YIM 151385]